MNAEFHKFLCFDGSDYNLGAKWDRNPIAYALLFNLISKIEKSNCRLYYIS